MNYISKNAIPGHGAPGVHVENWVSTEPFAALEKVNHYTIPSRRTDHHGMPCHTIRNETIRYFTIPPRGRKNMGRESMIGVAQKQIHPKDPNRTNST